MFSIQSDNMNWKNIFAISSGIFYIIFISLFLYYHREELLCERGSKCLRFCSSDTEKYSNKLLFESLKENNNKLKHNFDEVKIFRGLPTCSGNLEEAKKSNTTENESHMIYFHISKTCLDRVDDQSNKWITMICLNEDLSIYEPIFLTSTKLNRQLANIILLT